MESKEQVFLDTLLSHCRNRKIPRQEQGLIDALKELLEQAESNQPLDGDKLAYSQNKIIKVFCFSERYGGMVRHLEYYESRRLDKMY